MLGEQASKYYRVKKIPLVKETLRDNGKDKRTQ